MISFLTGTNDIFDCELTTNYKVKTIFQPVPPVVNLQITGQNYFSTCTTTSWSDPWPTSLKQWCSLLVSPYSRSLMWSVLIFIFSHLISYLILSYLASPFSRSWTWSVHICHQHARIAYGEKFSCVE